MEDMLGSPIQPTRLHEYVAERIRNLMLDESIHPGDRLPSERHLAERLGVSRLVIREALMALNMQGLIDVKPGSGAYVTEPSRQRVEETISFYLKMRKSARFHESILEVRTPLGIEIAGLAAERATDEHFVQLQAAIENMANHIDNAEDFARSDLEFHEVLASATGNELFPMLLGPISNLLLGFRIQAYEYDTRGAIEGGLRFHRLILDCVKRHDVDGARLAMRQHMEQAHTLYEAALNNDKDS
jgi:DNA-binding FadR family transcriptional regulator